jgi:hypothetical protein
MNIEVPTPLLNTCNVVVNTYQTCRTEQEAWHLAQGPDLLGAWLEESSSCK